MEGDYEQMAIHTLFPPISARSLRGGAGAPGGAEWKHQRADWPPQSSTFAPRSIHFLGPPRAPFPAHIVPLLLSPMTCRYMTCPSLRWTPVPNHSAQLPRALYLPLCVHEVQARSRRQVPVPAPYHRGGMDTAAALPRLASSRVLPRDDAAAVIPHGLELAVPGPVDAPRRESAHAPP